MSRPNRVDRSSRRASGAASRPCRTVLRCVRHAALAGLALVLVWPAARGSTEWLGWLPLWLVGMPLVAWWAVLRFPVPRLSWRRPQARRVQRSSRPRSPKARVSALHTA